MKFVHGVIIAVGLLAAANLVMISADLEAGNVLDYSKEAAVLDMEKSAGGEGTDGSEGSTTPWDTGHGIGAWTDEAEVVLGIGSGVPGCEETDECYIPHTVTVAAGGTVTWVNDDAGHTVTAGDIVEDPGSVGTAFPNGFDSGFFLAGNSYAHTFEEAGEYPYYCMVHPWMKGVVIVQ